MSMLWLVLMHRLCLLNELLIFILCLVKSSSARAYFCEYFSFLRVQVFLFDLSHIGYSNYVLLLDVVYYRWIACIFVLNCRSFSNGSRVK